jgi:hypothetical protein
MGSDILFALLRADTRVYAVLARELGSPTVKTAGQFAQASALREPPTEFAGSGTPAQPFVQFLD